MKFKYLNVRHFIAVTVLTISLSGCAETEFITNAFKKSTWFGTSQSYEDERSASFNHDFNKSKAGYKVGNPYQIFGVWYYPKADFNLVETGIASWYGAEFHKKNTANGEVFDKTQMTAAHRTLQMPSFAKVTNLENGKSVVVKINDRGPFKRGRVIDLSKKAADQLDFMGKGTARVKIEVLEHESRYIAEAAVSGTDTSKWSYNHVKEIVRKNRSQNTNIRTSSVKAEIPMQKPQMAEPKPIKNEVIAQNSIPESLMTPTITVEELYDNSLPVNSFEYKANNAAIISRSSSTQSSVSRNIPKTGLFVQAGSFLIQSNAEKLAKDLKDIAPTIVETVNTRAGQKMYRVKLGPIATVEEADNILSRVIQEGSATALIINR